MPNNDTPISSFQDATEINSADKLTGLQNNVNRNFSFSTILSWFVTTVAAAFVPVSRKVNNKALSADISLDASDVGAQAAITASGILKGDGAGGVSAAVEGTDYGTYSKPSGGIPSSDMTSAVQTSLGKADSAYQKPSGGIPASDLANGVIPSVPSPSDSTPQALGTAAAGSSGNYSRADHVHQKPTAADVTYDNTQSGLTAADVQEAIDELASGGSARGKADQTTIAPVEASTTATEAHPLGSTFYLGGVLYRALADIAIGGTINTGTGGNATQTTVAQNFKRTVTLTSAQYSQLSAAEKAADIVYIVTDEPVPAISTSTPNMDGVGSAGSTGEVADAGHVHPSDTSKANETELAYVETGSTASRAYAVGEYFCWNGLLYRVASPISSGGTITPGTNCEQVTGGGLNETINGIDISSYITPSPGVNISRAYRVGRLVYICGSVPKFTAANTVVSVGTMTKNKPFTSSAIGNLAQATASDFGYGNFAITTTGAMYAIYSKTTSYAVYFSICYYTVDL